MLSAEDRTDNFLDRLDNFSSSFCLLVCMQDTFARATHVAYAAARPSARATIGYLVYNLLVYIID